MGHIHKIVHYGVGPNVSDYFDGGFVLCLWDGQVVAKGYEK
jgi:hypothetical protein